MEKEHGDVENKIPGVSSLAINTVFNTKIGAVENKIPGSSGLVATTVLSTKNWRSWEQNNRC